MKFKTLYIILFLSFISLFTQVSSTLALSSNSATIAKHELSKNTSDQAHIQVLRAYLEEKDSPLAPSAETFIMEAKENNLDWKLVAAISGVESYFGQHIPQNSYNGWGWGVYGDNVHGFTSWDDAIKQISEGLRTNYINKWNAKNISEIGDIYASDPAWATKVTHFMDNISGFEAQKKTTSLSISL